MSDKINADVNGDSKVDIHDINEITGALVNGDKDKVYDVNNDGRVDIGDLADAIDATLNPAPAPWNGVTEVGGVKFKMTLVKGGTFTMGSPTTEMGRGTNEGPQHEVTISRYTSVAQTNPTGPATGSNKIYRGGSYEEGAMFARCTYRYMREPTYKSRRIGFRLAL